MEPIKLAVVLENHPVDIIAFTELFRGLGDLDVYVQSLEMLVKDEEHWDDYDVVLYYNLTIPLPEKDSLLQRYYDEHVGTTDQGIVLLHHGICCHRGDKLWKALSGIEDRRFQYHWDQTVRYDIADASHPITQGMKPFAMIDETYTMEEPAAEGTQVLITCDHPNSMRAIAWTRQYQNNRVFCYESGHDGFAYGNADFRQVLKRGILWCARRL